MKKYASLKALAAAFKAGELNGYELWLDNDCSGLHYVGPIPDGVTGAAADAFMDQKNDECRGWYKGHGYSDLSDACTAAGIPNSWV